MFDNISEKLKSVAKFFFWFGVGVAALSVFLGIVDAIDQEDGTIFLIVSLAAVGYFFFNWFLSLFIYGFGQLLENTRKDYIPQAQQFQQTHYYTQSAPANNPAPNNYAAPQNHAAPAHTAPAHTAPAQNNAGAPANAHVSTTSYTNTNMVSTATASTHDAPVNLLNPITPNPKGLFECECPTCLYVQNNNRKSCERCGQMFKV